MTGQPPWNEVSPCRPDPSRSSAGRFAVRTVALALAVAITAVAAVTALARYDPLGPAGWQPRADPRPSKRARPFAADGAVRDRGPARRAVGLTVRVLGVLVILATANYAAGWLWDDWAGPSDRAAEGGPLPGSIDALAASPASGEAPWSDRYWDEFAGLDYEYPPFLLSRVSDVDGDLITSADGVRRSYSATSRGDRATEVWFFGGGALWGEGQRDLHTIPSEVARHAERDGQALVVRNFGQPGYTSWQSALLLEQELATRPAPDLVVFYDGADDVAVQVETPSDQPTFYNQAGTLAAVVDPGDPAPRSLGELWDAYRERSMINRVLQRTGLLATDPAAADETALAERVEGLHARSVDLASSVAGEHSTEVLFCWQAATGVRGDDGAYRELAAHAEGVDLSRALDEHREVYLDGVLVNEQGAALLAPMLWDLIRGEID